MERLENGRVSSGLEYSFDFDRYIAKQIREIDDADERRFARKVLADGLGAIIRQTEQKYKELEERIFQEIEIPGGCYGIVSTVIQRKDYESSNGTLFPVFPADLHPETCRKLLSSEKYIYAGTVFLEADISLCREFEALGTVRGTIGLKEGGGKEEADFYIRPSARYRDAIEKLYDIFLENQIPWETVNTGYLDRFYDLYISAEICADRKDGAGQNMAAEDADIDFGRFADRVRKGMVPLWNIEAVSFDSMDFMMPCIDGIYYEHEFSLEGSRQGDGYLIQPRKEILEIRHEQGRIIIRSSSETFQKWNALRIIQKETVRSWGYDFPLLGNRRKDTFLGRYAAKTGMRLMTKADLFRRVREMDAGGCIEVKDCRILESTEIRLIEGSMNWFLQEELFPLDSRRILLLEFCTKKPGYYLNDSMVCYIVSSLQMDIGEYRCAGIITDKG